MRNRFFMCNCKLPMKLQILRMGEPVKETVLGLMAAMAAELEQAAKENSEQARGR